MFWSLWDVLGSFKVYLRPYYVGLVVYYVGLVVYYVGLGAYFVFRYFLGAFLLPMLVHMMHKLGMVKVLMRQVLTLWYLSSCQGNEIKIDRMMPRVQSNNVNTTLRNGSKMIMFAWKKSSTRNNDPCI